MKKFFSFVAVLCIAVAASANVVWTETLDKNGTYINKDDFNGYWPYASLWWEKGNFVHEYTNVASYTCSIRSKKLNSDASNTIGFYFSATKAAKDCYLTLEGTIYTAQEGDKLMFEINSPENGSPEEDVTAKLAVSINDEALTITNIVVPATANTVTVELPLPAVAITKMHISFDNVAKQKFITNLRIEDQATAIGNTTVAEKAVKVIENGQLVIIRNGVKFNAVGAVIE